MLHFVILQQLLFALNSDAVKIGKKCQKVRKIDMFS